MGLGMVKVVSDNYNYLNKGGDLQDLRNNMVGWKFISYGMLVLLF